jgi:DNA-binding transcriptional regulator YhcF (GntR family)
VVRIWISRESTIPVREQLSAQLRFGILTGRLAAAERLPSVRDLARRMKIHPNTVSAAYQDLAKGGWVTAKSGSGVFVRDIKRGGKSDGIHSLVQGWIEEGLSRGFTLGSLRAEFEKASGAQREIGRLLVVHADLPFARILAAEIEEAAGVSVDSALPQDPIGETSLVLTTASGAAAVAHVRPDRRMLIPLKTIDQVMSGVRQPPSPFLIAIVSRSESILKWASLLITALGGPGNDVLQRNPDRPKWKDGLAACDLVVADVLTALELPGKIRPLVLRLVPDSFLEEARRLVTAEEA